MSTHTLLWANLLYAGVSAHGEWLGQSMQLKTAKTSEAYTLLQDQALSSLQSDSVPNKDLDFSTLIGKAKQPYDKSALAYTFILISEEVSNLSHRPFTKCLRSPQGCDGGPKQQHFICQICFEVLVRVQSLFARMLLSPRFFLSFRLY